MNKLIYTEIYELFKKQTLSNSEKKIKEDSKSRKQIFKNVLNCIYI